MPTDSGDARKLGPGEYVAFDPLRHDLVVQLNEKEGIRLARMPVSGGTPEPIRAQGEAGIGIIGPLGPNAVRPDGIIVISGYFRDSWFNQHAILDPVSGSLRRTPLRYDADILDMSWNQKNQIVLPGCLVRSSLWRFRPQK